VETGEVIDTFRSNEDEVSAIAFSSNGKWLATGEGNFGQTVRLWNLDRRESYPLKKDASAWFPGIYSLVFSPDSNLLAIARNDNQIILWNLEEQKEIRRLKEHQNKVYTLAFHPNGNIIASGSEDNTIKLWNVNTGKELASLSQHEQAVLAVAFSPDGNYLISASQDQTLVIWEN
jgi:WD40 repeat protein